MHRRAAIFRALSATALAALTLLLPPGDLAWAQVAQVPAPAESTAAPAAPAPQLAPSTTLGAPEAAPAEPAPAAPAEPASPAPKTVEPQPLPPAAPVAVPVSPTPAPGAAPDPQPAAGASPADATPKSGSPPAAAPAAKPAPPVDPRIDTGPIIKPPVQTGDSWTYRRSDGKSSAVMRQTTTKATDEGIALRTELARTPGVSTTALYDREWGLVASGYNDYRPALRYYSYPLYAGKRWSINAAISNFGAGQTSGVKGEAWATGWEQVEVPAGKFLALKIEIDIETSDPANPERVLRVRETHWYARTVMRPVKVESHAVVGDAEPTGEVIELMSYRME